MFANQQKTPQTSQPAASARMEKTGSRIQINDFREFSAIQRQLVEVIQRERKDREGLVKMTVSEFITHTEAEQMDWANLFNQEKERKIIWSILECVRQKEILKTFVIENILNKNTEEPAVEDYMMYASILPVPTSLDDIVTLGKGVKILNQNWPEEYRENIIPDNIYRQLVTDLNTMPAGINDIKICYDASVGKFKGKPTIFITSFPANLDEVKKISIGLCFLHDCLPGEIIQATIPFPVFKDLILQDTILAYFIYYLRIKSPILQTPDGEEVKAFIDFCDTDGWNGYNFYESLSIRNLHKFYMSSLDKLEKDAKSNETKPLTLILYSLVDHSGSLIRNNTLKEVIENDKIKVCLIEGMNLSKIEPLAINGLKDITRNYKSKITQVVIVGHGSPTTINMAPEHDPSPIFDDENKKFKMKEDGTGNISFSGKSSNLWDTFFKALSKEMEDKGELKKKVLLFACSAGDLDSHKLFKEDDVLIKMDDIPEILNKLGKDNGSVAASIRKSMHNRVIVEAARGTIYSSDAHAIKDSGEVHLETGYDPAITGSALEYIESGYEAVGALHAVMEIWKTNNKTCIQKMQARLDKPVKNEVNEVIIRLLYSFILKRSEQFTIYVRLLDRTVIQLSNLAEGGNTLSPELFESTLVSDAPYYSELLLPLIQHLERPESKLVAYFYLMTKDNAQRMAFLEEVGANNWNYYDLKKHLPLSYFESHLHNWLSIESGNKNIMNALVVMVQIVWKTGYLKKQDESQSAEGTKSTSKNPEYDMVKNWFQEKYPLLKDNIDAVFNLELYDFKNFINFIPFAEDDIPEAPSLPPDDLMDNIDCAGYKVIVRRNHQCKNVIANKILKKPEKEDEPILPESNTITVKIVGVVKKYNPECKSYQISKFRMVCIPDGRIGYAMIKDLTK